MKQVTQRLRDGRIEVLDVPPPALTPDGVLVDVRASLLSAGTERAKVATARQSLVGKARSRPDQVRQVVEKAQRDGVRSTIEAVRTRLDSPSALGYSAAGVVTAVGTRVTDLAPGDRVACGGGDYAVHAEIDHVPGNLCVRLPDLVTFAHGAFATVGSIALHGVRQADVRLGERIAVIGLGLVGQLTGQILRVAGCEVVGIDIAPDLVDRAVSCGAADVGYHRAVLDGALPAAAENCDAVVITAATTSDDPVLLAARLCRDRGRVVVVGVVGMSIPRLPFYLKEIELRMSRSYGPGRYDRAYEERGLDYPIGYVRWTERRNMETFVELVARGRVDVSGLITAQLPLQEAPRAYERLVSSSGSTLGIVLEYKPSSVSARPAPTSSSQRAPNPLAVGLIGAGSFAQRILIPGLRSAGFSLEAVASAKGLSARTAAERFDFGRADTVDSILEDPGIGTIVIATQHATHAELAERALRAGKAVFVEKPPALDPDGLRRLRAARAESARVLAVGFNRRYAALAEAMRLHVAGRHGPLELVYRVNADPLPADHWLNDPDEGGGRLVGEGCHFVDFACWMVGALPESVTTCAPSAGGRPLVTAERFTIALGFADGSVATVIYGVAGGRSVGKEHAEAHADGRSAILEDFRTLYLHEGRRPRRVADRSRDKGHRRQLEHLAGIVDGKLEASDPDPLDSMAVTFAALRSAGLGETVSMDEL